MNHGATLTNRKQVSAGAFVDSLWENPWLVPLRSDWRLEAWCKNRKNNASRF